MEQGQNLFMVTLKGMSAGGEGGAGFGAYIGGHDDIVKVPSLVASIEGVEGGLGLVSWRDEFQPVFRNMRPPRVLACGGQSLGNAKASLRSRPR